MSGTKRLFFALEVEAEWPEKLPKGRLLEEKERHLTLAFLGNVPYQKVLDLLEKLPKPAFGRLNGKFVECLFLPPRKAKCVSWRVAWSEKGEELAAYQKELSRRLYEEGLLSEENYRREFLPHVTLCRAPFNKKEWQEAFSPLPMKSGRLRLYESVGELKYLPLWSCECSP